MGVSVKKWLVVLISVFALSGAASAQNFSIGVNLGGVFGGSAALDLNPNFTVKELVSFSRVASLGLRVNMDLFVPGIAFSFTVGPQFNFDLGSVDLYTGFGLGLVVSDGAGFAFTLVSGVEYALNRQTNLVGEFLIGFYGGGALFGIRGGVSFNL
jgi:hypothetical protein